MAAGVAVAEARVEIFETWVALSVERRVSSMSVLAEAAKAREVTVERLVAFLEQE